MNNILSDRDFPQAKTTVLLVSDDLESARIWSYSLQQAGLEVCLAGFSEKTLRVWSSEFPDLIILEDHNSTEDIFSFCRQLRAEAAIPLVILTSSSLESYLLDAYHAGADDCVPPPVSPRLFLAKVKAWLRRAQVVPSAALDVVHAGDFRLDPDRRVLTLPNGQAIKLTNLETRLLYLMLNHPAWIIETEYLVNRVWGHFGEGDGILLKNLIYRLRRKIEPNPSQPVYLLTESNLGYRFRPEGGQLPSPVNPAGGHSEGSGARTNDSRLAPKRAADPGELTHKPRPRHTGQLYPRFPKQND